MIKDIADGPIQPLLARQCSKRGGELWVRVHDCEGSVLVSGSAAVVVAGTLRIG
jgi:hypothetical protein